MQDGAQRAAVERGPHLVVEAQQPHEHRRHQVARPHGPLVDEAQGGGGVEAGHEDELGPGVQVADREAQRGGVVQRPGDEVGARAVEPDPASHGGQRRQLVGHRGRARAHDALRPARGPRRVQHRAAGRPVERERLVAGRRQQAVELLPDLHHLDVESGHRLGGHGGVGRLGDEQPGAGVVDDVADLVGGQVPVHGGEPGAGQDGRGGELDQLDPVAEQQGHRAAGRHAGLAEEASGPRGPVDELAAGAPPRQVVEGGRIGVGGGEVEQRHARIMSDWTGRPAARRSVRAGHGAHYVVAMAGGGHGTKAVVAALLANAGIAVAKFVGFLITGSGSMLAESVHSVADSGNQALLLLGGRKAQKAPTAEHPFGYGRERYFWAFVVAIILFSLGGMFATYEGIEKIRHPHELESITVAIVILLVAIVLEAFSFRTAIVESLKVKDPQVSWWTFIRRSKNPELPVVLLEDLGAQVGLVIALIAVSVAQRHRRARVGRRRHPGHRPAAHRDRGHPGRRDEGPAHRRVGVDGRPAEDRGGHRGRAERAAPHPHAHRSTSAPRSCWWGRRSS